MIPSYSAYIKNHILKETLGDKPVPGEHHFVSVYLVPKLYELNKIVPDYINPDGMKSILGDIVFYKDNKHHFGIEVKLGTIRLTKREYNDWIVCVNLENWPSVFIGICRTGIALCSWEDFRSAYIKACGIKELIPIDDGYGPMKVVGEIARHVPQGTWFKYLDQINEAAESEAQFLKALREHTKNV
jgi:hypothetical protein